MNPLKRLARWVLREEMEEERRESRIALRKSEWFREKNKRLIRKLGLEIKRLKAERRIRAPKLP